MGNIGEGPRIELKNVRIQYVPSAFYHPAPSTSWYPAGWYLVYFCSSLLDYDRMVVQLLEKDKN